ncbi:two-component system response regulator [Brumicola pallidula]|jgi:diguanylate cyclase (GGDEF)-like protein|uniref:cyclic-guanylate-specific phosphodiesterase n=1 Tax=Brumicola pallidula DSM 14239 = ACAM 615 TaxID=1121922 RepID=K6YCN7_9ALTE|nr:EAL domain-containing protein [Glaciecola pallidula]GAC30504.1 signaling protein ykoW [Glaciecola pallidula DSM 14239 = ACAM 615]
MTEPSLNSGTDATVLVCDDDPTYLLLMEETLSSDNLNVLTAANGLDALKLYLKHEPSIVLLDVHMPMLSGFEVCAEIRKHPKGKDTPILMVTGADDILSIESAYKHGATDFLPKPIRWPMVAHRVRYMLKGSETFNSLKQSEEKMRRLAYFDSLTGLPNRQSLDESLEKAIRCAVKEQQNLCIMYIDLDNFKRINDTLGHEFGDKLLKKISEKIIQCLKGKTCIPEALQSVAEIEVSRLGGDEFMILLNNTTNDGDVKVVAQSLVDCISELVSIDDHEVALTPSIGIAIYPRDGANLTELKKHADVAMYYAKTMGRNGYRFYAESLNKNAMKFLQIEGCLRNALNNDEFSLHYQPQVCLKSHKIISVEALLRWESPELGNVTPSEFIPVAEDSGIINDLGEWVMRKSCVQAKKWMDAGMQNFRVSVNLSSIQFKRASLLNMIKRALDDSGLPASLLEVELTESAIMNDIDQNITRLNQIRDLGVAIALDDFGTGYSSLSYLKRFPINTLKIDRSFIITIDTDPEDAAIVEAIITLANTLKLTVIAEGVETHGQLKALNRFHCDIIQGFYFSKPVPAEQITKIVQQPLNKDLFAQI